MDNIRKVVNSNNGYDFNEAALRRNKLKRDNACSDKCV